MKKIAFMLLSSALYLSSCSSGRMAARDNDDDYYDYAYSSRIRRFYHPVGWSYYDSYYTNMYWYDYDPYSYGVSLYLSYDWWRPRYTWTPGWGVSFGYGDPYYGYNSGWGGY